MHLLGTWKVIVKDGDETHEVVLSEVDLETPIEFPQMAFEDWCTDDVGVTKYDEIHFVFIPDERVWNVFGDSKSSSELHDLLVESGQSTPLNDLEMAARDGLIFNDEPASPFAGATTSKQYLEGEIVQVRDDVIFARDIYNEVRAIDPNLIPDAKVGQVIDFAQVPSVPTNQLGSMLG